LLVYRFIYDAKFKLYIYSNMIVYLFYREGKNPWSTLTRLLSGRIRQARFVNKRKSDDVSSEGGSPIFKLSQKKRVKRESPECEIHGSSTYSKGKQYMMRAFV